MSAIILDQTIVHYEAMDADVPSSSCTAGSGHGDIGLRRCRWPPPRSAPMRSTFSGMENTAHDSSRYSLEQQASLVTRFLDEMGIGKIAIVGHGLGALVGLQFATRRPGNVDRIMAVNLPPDFNSINAKLRTSTAIELADWLSSRTPESVTALSDASKVDTGAIAASMNSFQSDRLFTQFRATDIPCLLVYGQNDPSITVPTRRDVACNVSTFHSHAPDQPGRFGHFPMIDETAKFNRLLIDFLALDSGLSPRELELKEEWKRRVRNRRSADIRYSLLVKPNPSRCEY